MTKLTHFRLRPQALFHATAWALSWLASSLGAQTAAPSLTLSGAVTRALEHNLGLRSERARFEASQAKVDFARSSYFPKLSFSQSVVRSNNPVFVFGTLLNQRQFTAANFDVNFLNRPEPLNNLQSRFLLAQPIFDRFETRHRLAQARLSASAVELQLERKKQEVIVNVARAYLSALLAREQVKVAEQALKTAETDLDTAKQKAEAGLVVEADRLSAQAHVADLREQLIRARNQQALALAHLNFEIGAPLEESASIVEETGQDAAATREENFTELKDRALKLRPDLLAAQKEVEIAKKQTTVARNAFLPSIDFMGSWEADQQTFASSRYGTNWTVGATLTFNLFNGGADRARLHEAQANASRVDLQTQQFARAVQLEVRQALANWSAARERVAATRDAAAQAAESLRIHQDRYVVGLTTMTNLLAAETALVAAQTNFLRAQHDLRLAQVEVEFATGELSPQSSVMRSKNFGRNE